MSKDGNTRDQVGLGVREDENPGSGRDDWSWGGWGAMQKHGAVETL